MQSLLWLGRNHRSVGHAGITATEIWPGPDPFPIMRAKVSVEPEAAGLNAMALSVMLADGDPSVKTRGHHVEEGYFLLDPFNLTDADADYICDRVAEVLDGKIVAGAQPGALA